MIKTILIGTVLTLGLGTSMAFAQDRTISYWGYDYTVPNAAPQQPSFSALAPRTAVPDQVISIDGHRRHRHP